MLETRKTQLITRPVFKVILRLMCLLVLLTSAAYLTSPGKAQGTRISCLFDEGDGNAILVSCGSSAGNFIGECGGGACTIWNDPADDWLANQACADYQANGCPSY